ncbi:glycosyltransferase family 41 protein [Laetiporus sulphureus 93-53]|uniref:protein O-GlcNAc transferase n=1 Tax=Laetiporus sulphureus 93-53 TaxID=1314785 RepID=A0A165CFJ4_9APHY|nr:glycosyltransferase family 41 protein [Laetiporus sulphureus 93-53]KZT02719.1 glycosyltransferase family 41 protein [Laetiporus sulphureus 93-53]
MARDAAMAYAYHLYESSTQPPAAGLTHTPMSMPITSVAVSTENVYKFQLLPLLTTLRSLHPRHLPILLLLACTYHALGDYQASLKLSHDMLAIDNTYVEAMSNIGTTYKAMGQDDKAFEWWLKALRIKPTYWDAIDNVLGRLFSATQNVLDNQRRFTTYLQAIRMCEHIQREVVDPDGRLRTPVPTHELHRLQRLFFIAGTLRTLIRPDGVEDAIIDYFKAVELVIRPPLPYPDDECYTMLDLVLAVCVAGYMLSAVSNGHIPTEIAESMNITVQHMSEHHFPILRYVHASSHRLLNALLRLGGGILPTVLLLPEQIMHLPMVLFPYSGGVLPSMCTRDPDSGNWNASSEDARQKTNLMTSTVLLTLAKRLQDDSSANRPLPIDNGSVSVSTSLVILLYYLALSLSSSPSTYNNIGILLCSLSSARTVRDLQGQRHVVDGPVLAKLYYQVGLQLDPGHPHLLTNMGSLLKDQGHVNEAIEFYMKAIQHKSDFDIAWANLANAIKDMGRPWDAIDYYRRAVSLNSNLPEAICGLVNSLCSVCDWRGRGTVPQGIGVDDSGGVIPPSSEGRAGWITKMVEICEQQIDAGYMQNVGVIRKSATVDEWLQVVETARGRSLREDEKARWRKCLGRYYGDENRLLGGINETGFIIRFIDWVQPRLQRQWYLKAYGRTVSSDQPMLGNSSDLAGFFLRPILPANLSSPLVPSVLPFHTFTYPLSPRMTRLITHRNALRISYMALSQTWLPKHVFRPPPPPLHGKLNIGYVSNDVNDHPLSHLMQSVFGFHDRDKFNVFLYTTSPWDGSDYRPRIAQQVENFIDVSTWPANAVVEHILRQDIHILINLGGYTKGARNDIFAVRPCPVQIQLMGYAGTLSAGWCDYLVGCETSCPPEMSATELWRKSRGDSRDEDYLTFDLDADADPESGSNDWVYTEKLMNVPHSFMVTDHKQSYREDECLTPEERERIPVEQLWLDEEKRRAEMRRGIFPDLPQEFVIFANFSQVRLPMQGIFATWLEILVRVPHSVLWLLRFPIAGEEHLLRTARTWAGEKVASRIRFTDVARKKEHVYRCRVADLFLDTVECNAHTVAADVLWTGTPILTYPKHPHKMCSRVAASMARATQFERLMVVNSIDDYKERAIQLAESVRYVLMLDASGTVVPRGRGTLMSLRRNIFLNRDRMPLFDTMRWTRNLEKGLREAWRRWVEGTQYEMTDEWEACQGPEKESGCICISDDDPVNVVVYN